MTEYSSIASYAIGLAVNLTVIGAFFIAGITLAFRSLGPASARARYIIALTILLASALLPTVVTFSHSGQVAHSSASARTVGAGDWPSAVIPNQEPLAGFDNPTQREGADGGLSSAEELELMETGEGASRLNALVSLAARSWFGIIFLALWITVSFLLIAREVAGHVRLARERSSWRLAGDKTRISLAWPGGIPLFVSIGEGPCTLGGFRPAVVIPAGLLDDMPQDTARIIARHELAHARWRDPLANALVRIIRAVLWPSLPLWYLERVVRAEREVAADQFAMDALQSTTVGDAAVEYAALLVSIARRSDQDANRWRFGLVATEAGGGTNFEYRVRRLLEPQSKLTRARILLATFAMLLCACGAAFAPVTARPLSIASLPGDDPQAADSSAAEGDTMTVGPRQPGEGLSRGETEVDAGTVEQSTRMSFSQEATAGGERVGIIPRAQPDPQNEKGPTQYLIYQLAALGYSDLSPDQIAAVKTYGVSPTYVKELASIGYGRLTADALINFRSLGVNPAYIKEMKGLGYGDLPANTMIDFRLYGINSAYIREVAAFGFSNIPARTLVAFRRVGINAEYVSNLRSTVTGSISADDLLALRRQGVTVSYVKGLKAKGYDRLTVNQLLELRSGKGAGGAS